MSRKKADAESPRNAANTKKSTLAFVFLRLRRPCICEMGSIMFVLMVVGRFNSPRNAAREEPRPILVQVLVTIEMIET